MIAKNILNQLIQQLGKENVVFTEEDLLVLGYDATPGLHHAPDIVVYPTSTEAVQAAMQIAREEKMPITPRGSGSGLSGGSIPAKGGMVICLNRMNYFPICRKFLSLVGCFSFIRLTFVFNCLKPV